MYGGTKEEMQRLIDDANKLGEAMGESSDLSIDSFADVITAINRVQTSMGITGTTAKEAAQTISGSIEMAKASWENFLTGLGNENADMSKLTDQLLESIGNVANNVVPRVAQIGSAIVSALPGALVGLGETLAPYFADAVSTAWNAAVNALSAVGIQLPEIDASQVMEALNSLAEFVGQVIGRIQEGLAFLGEAFAPAFTAIQTAVTPIVEQISTTIMPILDSISQALSNLATAVLPIISAAIQAIAPVLGTIIGMIIQVATTVVSTVVPIINNVAAVIQSVLPVIQFAFQVAGMVIMNVINTVFPVMQAIVTTAMTVIQTVVSTVLTAISSTWSSIWNSVSAAFSSIWAGIQSAASSAIEGVYNTVIGIKDRIIGFFSDAYSWLLNAGHSIVQGLADGISGAIGAATGAISNVLSAVRSYLPFSPAKKGPFSGKGWTLYSGASMVTALAEGVARSGSAAVSAMENVMGGINGAINIPDAESLGYSITSGGYNTVTSTYDNEHNDRMSNLLTAIEGLREDVRNMNVYLDGKTLVGGIAYDMNRELGRMVR